MSSGPMPAHGPARRTGPGHDRVRRLYRAIVPRPVRWFVRRTQHVVNDGLLRTFRRRWQRVGERLEVVLGQRDALVPPKRLDFIGLGDFVTIGDEFRRHFVAPGGLQADDDVLDVGCGTGRMARPLTTHLSRRGSSEGFDVVPAGIDWCTANITRRYPTFRFQLADVFSAFYHPQGCFKASEYRFPYAEGSFDFVFLVSVFTHMLPDDMENYLREVARVLRPGKRCFITFFLVNEESLRLMSQGAASQDFKDTGQGVYVVDRSQPELVLAYEEATVRQLFARYGLRILEPVHYGSWCQRAKCLSYQDIIVAEKA
jgi:SAM-dependent methyltransferase